MGSRSRSEFEANVSLSDPHHCVDNGVKIRHLTNDEMDELAGGFGPWIETLVTSVPYLLAIVLFIFLITVGFHS